MKRTSFLAICAASSLLTFAGGGAAQVPDPTRPPDFLQAPTGGATTMPTESGVQTVILRPGHKASAVINGQHVVVGGKLSDKRVVRITEGEVVLKGPSGIETIKVTPGVEKAPRPVATDTKTRNRGTSNK